MHAYIRPLQLDTDLKDIHRLTHQLGYQIELERIQKHWQLIHLDPHYQTLVIESNAQVIGYAGLIKQYSWEFEDGFFRIQAFVIDEQYRSLGLGRTLMQAIEKIAIEQGLKRILLNSGNRPERYPAHVFYKSLGFEAYSLGFTKYLK